MSEAVERIARVPSPFLPIAPRLPRSSRTSEGTRMASVGRRDFVIGAAACLGVPLDAKARSSSLPHRIGYLALRLSGAPLLTESFQRGLRDLGHEDRNLVIEFRDAEAGASGSMRWQPNWWRSRSTSS